MKKVFERLRTGVSAVPRKAKVRVGMVLGAIFVLQLYFVRELMAAELLFVLAFAVLFAVGIVSYAAGALGERAWVWIEAGVRSAGPYAVRGYNFLEEISRKPFRHPRSESAQ